MPTAIALNSRLIALEDVALTTNASGETYSANVLGLGTTTLHKLSPLLLTSLIQAASETLSTITSNVAQGGLYYNTTTNSVAARILPWRETPTGSINGTNAVFTFLRSPLRLMFYKNGLFLKEGTEYTLSGTTATFQGGSGTAIVAGSTVVKSTGSSFLPHWAGDFFVVDGSTYTVQSVVSATQLVLTASPSSQGSGLAWSCTGAPGPQSLLEGIYWS